MAKRKSKPGERVFVERLELNRVQGEYRLTLVTTDGFETEMRTDGRLGNICAAWSVALKALATERGEAVTQPVTAASAGTIALSYYNIRPIEVWPYRWHVAMHGHGFKYEANIDGDLEHVILAYSGAMKFFSYKLGLTVLYDEVIRNRDAAGELGLLEGGAA